MKAPDRFAVLADIHGNADALRVVLKDIASQGIQEVLNLGDHFSGPLDAAGTWALLAQHPMRSLRGNHDRWLIEHRPERMGASDRSAFDALPPEALDWVQTLPATLTPWQDVFACHATPEDDNRYWVEHVTSEGQISEKSLEQITALVAALDAPLLLCGHSHLPRVTRLNTGQVLLNPGSVGCPAYRDDEPVPHRMQTGSPHACYAIVERATAGWAITHRRLPYDTTRMAALAEANNRPDWARAIRTGRA